jgi:hypothetical protein
MGKVVNKPPKTPINWTDGREVIEGGPVRPDPPAKDINLTPENPHWVCISSNALHWHLYLMLGEGQIIPTGGVAQWDEVAIPEDKSVSEFTGVSLAALAVPVLLDAWLDPLEYPGDPEKKQVPEFGNIKKAKKRRKLRQAWREIRDTQAPENIGAYIDLLRSLAQPRGEGAWAPVIRVYGKAMPRGYNGLSWVITDIEEGERLHEENGGPIRRQAMTLQLAEFNKAGVYDFDKRRKRKRGKKQKRRYLVKKGDTLQEIAKKVYGEAYKWERIARENDIKNPRRLDKYVGKRIKIP